MIAARILGTGSATHGRLVTNVEIARAAYPELTPEALEDKTGIHSRHWLGAGERAAPLAAEALRGALARAGLEASGLRRLILVSSTGGDHLIPATANDVAAEMGLDDTCDAFDLNNSCVGFLSAFDVAARSVATGVGPVAVVAVEVFSRHLSPLAPRAYAVLGDAAAAAVLGPGTDGAGVLASYLRNSAALRGQMCMPHARPGAPAHHDFGARNQDLKASALASIRHAVSRVLSETGLAISDVDWFLPHQPNGGLFDLLVRSLEIDPARTVPVVREIGSVGSAAVPTSLDRLLRTRDVAPGAHVLMASVGAGTAYGAILYRVAS